MPELSSYRFAWLSCLLVFFLISCNSTKPEWDGKWRISDNAQLSESMKNAPNLGIGELVINTKNNTALLWNEKVKIVKSSPSTLTLSGEGGFVGVLSLLGYGNKIESATGMAVKLNLDMVDNHIELKSSKGARPLVFEKVNN